MLITACPDWQLISNPHCRKYRRSHVTGVVQHYTAAGNGRSLARWMAGPQSKVSAHIVICRDGHVIQQVSFNDEAWHAGDSNKTGMWKGAPQPENVNRFTIGIENSNYGWLLQEPDGSFWIKKRTQWGFQKARPYKGPQPLQAEDHKGNLRWWEPFSEELVAANVTVLKRIRDMYPHLLAEDIQGHSDVSPHRKFDPGPVWPAEYVEGLVFGSPSSTTKGEISLDEEFEYRDYYDEEKGLCVDPHSLRSGS